LRKCEEEAFAQGFSNLEGSVCKSHAQACYKVTGWGGSRSKVDLVMKTLCRFDAIRVLAAVVMLALGSMPAAAQSTAGTAQARAHVYLLRGLMNIFSLGMDSLAEELDKRGVHTTVSNHSEWPSLADQATSNYKAGKEDPIILIGHSLGADAVMQMAAYLNRKKIPVALVVPFDGTASFSTPANVGRLVNLTQRKYAYMRPGPGFHGSLANVDVSSDPSIDHINIDKSPRLHTRAISEVLAVIKGHRVATPSGANPSVANSPPSVREEAGVKVSPSGGDGKPVAMPAPSGMKPGNGATSESAPSLSQDARRPKAIAPAKLPD
jgi:hypothetical protein